MKDLFIAVFSASIVFFLCRWIYRYSLKKEVTFFDKKKNVTNFLLVFYLASIGFLGADFLIHKHDHIEIGNAPEFYAIYGFVSCVLMVLVAKVFRVLIKRDETYYD